MRTNLKIALILPILLFAGLLQAQLQVMGDVIVAVSPGTTVVGIEESDSAIATDKPIITIAEGTQLVGNFYVAGEAIHFEKEKSKEHIVEKPKSKNDSVDLLMAKSEETEDFVIEPIEQEEEELPLILVQHKSSSGLGGGAYVQHLLVLPTPSHQKANLSTNEFNLIYFLEFYKEIEQYIVDKTSYGFIPIVNSRPPPLV